MASTRSTFPTLCAEWLRKSSSSSTGVPCSRNASPTPSPYKLTDAEARLYRAVTDYVREEFNRAEALQNDRRAGTVGFALTILQRRLASSPEAIYQSLRRRRERLESRLQEVKLMQRGAAPLDHGMPLLDADDLEDLDDAPEDEVEAIGEEILDQATAARTVTELEAEIGILQRLQGLAAEARRTGDTKWHELARVLKDVLTVDGIAPRVAEPKVPYGAGQIDPPKPSPHQKIVIFTEHRDTPELPLRQHRQPAARSERRGGRHPRWLGA